MVYESKKELTLWGKYAYNGTKPDNEVEDEISCHRFRTVWG
jgi:hypothetical protein